MIFVVVRFKATYVVFPSVCNVHQRDIVAVRSHAVTGPVLQGGRSVEIYAVYRPTSRKKFRRPSLAPTQAAGTLKLQDWYITDGFYSPPLQVDL